MKKLHVLNGDSTLDQFNKTTIEGDTIVWREMLCEGKTTLNLNSEIFWKTRCQFLEYFLDDFDSSLHNRIKKEFQNLDLLQYEEITFWFEYDLFCQINLVGLLAWINCQKINSTTNISLICIGKHPNYQKLVGLGEISNEEFEELYPNRKPLNKTELEFADRIWEIYCSGKHENLLTEIQDNRTNNFKYLETAIFKHQKRFPSLENGLTEIESKIINSIMEEPKSKKEIIRKMLITQEIYGFGDLQYFKYLENLKPILKEKNGKLFINKLGEKVINNELDFNTLRKIFDDFGGTNLNKYRWNESNKKLMNETGP